MTAEARVLDWTEALIRGPNVVGGKAWQLARMEQFGLPVPEGLVIPAEWSRRWLAESVLEQQVVEAAQAGDEEQLRELARTLQHTAIPADLAVVLNQALADRGWLDLPLAVRSSAVGEDSKRASFAGIYRSCLNVRGREQFDEAIREVWASLWTPAAAVYRQRQGVLEQPAMGVILMPLLAAEASGIAFTCDPVSGRDDRMVIHAQWGLGESLVGGQTAGDEYRFAEDPLDDRWQLQSRQLGSKSRKAVALAAGGTGFRETSPEEASAFVLTPAEAEKLADLLQDAALALDFTAPFYDLEWALDGQGFWLTQARPVTARSRHTYPSLAGQPRTWSRGNTCEVVPDPLSPTDWSNSRRLVNALLEQGYAMGGYPLLPGLQRAGIFHGRIYLDLSLIQWEGYDAFGIPPGAMNTLIGGHQPEIEVPSPTLGDRLVRLGRLLRYAALARGRRRRGEKAIGEAMTQATGWRQQVPPRDGEGLQEELLRQLRVMRSARDLFFLQGSNGGSLTLLVAQLEKHFPGEGHALATALLAGGEPSITARQGYELMALARLGQADPLVNPLLNSAAPGDDWFSTLPPDNGFRLAFEGFIERYGHRGLYETYFRNSRWREEPGYLLASLSHLANVDEAALRQRQRSAVEEATQRIRTTVSLWKRPFLAALTRAANRESNQREAARSALMAYVEPIRRLLLAAGEYLAAREALETAEDIFQLTIPEIFRALAGEVPATGVQARLRERAGQFQTWLREAAPDVLTEAGDDPSPVWQDPHPGTLGDGGRCYQGVPTGTGRVRGRARLLRHPQEGQKLLPGEILVAPSTDPGWTPLFLKAGGLVVETGGYLSHGAIVAREFAIPAVVNLPGILSRLKDGDLLEVDGQKGTVTRL